MEDLSKAKVISRNGVRYYADGKHAGKRVGSVRQAETKLANGNLEHQIAVLDIEIKNNVADGKIITAQRKIKKLKELKAALKGEGPKLKDAIPKTHAELSAKFLGKKVSFTNFAGQKISGTVGKVDSSENMARVSDGAGQRYEVSINKLEVDSKDAKDI